VRWPDDGQTRPKHVAIKITKASNSVYYCCVWRQLWTIFLLCKLWIWLHLISMYRP